MGPLHHLALGAQDVETLAAFYVKAFGLRTVATHSHSDESVRSIWLDIGGAVLMIEPTSAAPHEVTGIGAGPFLLAFTVPQPLHTERIATLAALGAPVEDRTPTTTYHRDPEGNRVALSHYPLPLPDVPH